MRDLTQEEIRDYLRFAITDDKRSHPEFNQQQAQLIGTAFVEIGLMRDAALICAKRIVSLPLEELRSEDLMLSLLVWAFQMGRECESRLLTNALKARTQ